MARIGIYPLIPPANIDCYNAKSDLNKKIYDAYTKQLKADRMLNDLVYNLLTSVRRNMPNIAPTGSECETNFGSIETQTTDAKSVSGSNFDVLNMALINDINNLDCDDPNWQNIINSYQGLVDSTVTAAENDNAKAQELKEAFYQWSVNCLPSNYPEIVYDPVIWG